MAVIRGMMPAFELFQPASVDDALALLDRHGRDAWVLGGGLDTFDALYDRVHQPPVVVDLGGLQELKGIRETADGLEIGAMTTLTDVARHPVVRERFGLLRDAAELVGSPQIRNQGTIGGNVSQATRCWYYRGGWTCYRAGGNVCYADTPTAMNREHAIFDANRCVAVNPSDTAPALVALDATMVIRSLGQRAGGGGGGLLHRARGRHHADDGAPPGDLLTAIRIPATWAGARFYFEKVRERKSWDFALVNVASAVKVAGGSIRDIRLVVNAVGRPAAAAAGGRGRRAGQAGERGDGDAGGGDWPSEGARALGDNGYKIPLVRNLVKRAIRGGGPA